MATVNWEAEKEKPDKEVTKRPKYIAAFISTKKGLKLWITGPHVDIIPGVGRHIVQGSGDFIDFQHGKYQTSDKKKIKYLLEHKGFSGNNGNWFFPDPSDPTGFWLHKGYYKETEVKARVPANPNEIIDAGKKQAIEVTKQFATKTEPLRTSTG